MERITRSEELTREQFDSALRAWTRLEPPESTIGDVGNFGGKAWLHVRDQGRAFHLNADTQRQGVLEYLALLDADPDVDWHVVPNARGHLNKAAFGPSERTIPGFYLYLSRS